MLLSPENSSFEPQSRGLNGGVCLLLFIFFFLIKSVHLESQTLLNKENK